MLRIPHCLDNLLINDGEVIILTRRPRSTHQKHLVFLSVELTYFNDRINPMP
jgi:hypothetical protein